MMSLLIAASILLLFWYGWRRRTILSLDWPDDLSLDRFRNYIKVYLKSTGWKVIKLEDTYDELFAERGGTRAVLVCLSSLVTMTTATLPDFLHHRNEDGKLPRVLVFQRPVGKDFLVEAAERQLYVISYKTLSSFPDLSGLEF